MKHNGPDQHLLIQYQVGGQDDDEHDTNLLDETFDPIKKEVGATGFELGFHQIQLQLVLPLALKFFPDKGLDHQNRFDEVDEPATFVFPLGFQHSPYALQFFGLPEAYPKIHGQNAQGNAADVHVGRKHDSQGHDGIGREGENVDKEILNELGQTLDAPVDAGLQLFLFDCYYRCKSPDRRIKCDRRPFGIVRWIPECEFFRRSSAARKQ